MLIELNEKGKTEIDNFLKENHTNKFFLQKELEAWYEEAEIQYGETGSPTIEIKSCFSKNGQTCCYSVSESGIKKINVDDE